MDDEVDEHDDALMDKAVAMLRRHFDSVQVFVTRSEPGGDTMGFTKGDGNWYARIGQVTEWIDNGGGADAREME